MLNPAVLLWPLAAGMAATTAVLIRWAAEARTPLRAGTVVFLFLMMAAMFGGAALYFLHPGTASLVEGFWVASAVMSVSAFAVFAGHARELKARLEGGEHSAPPSLLRLRAFVATIIALVLANELLMGWTFGVASGQSSAVGGGGFAAIATGLIGVVDSPWFLFTMATEMLLTAFFLRDRLPRPVLVVLLIQSLIMFLSPPALPYAPWNAGSIYITSGAMIVLFVYLLEFLYRNKQLSGTFSVYLVRLLAVYGLMMAGLVFWFVYASPFAFALSVGLEMVLFFDAVVRPERFRTADRVSWQLRPHWTFAVLLFVFVAEIFMGALLDAQIVGASFLAHLPALPLTGSVLTVLNHAAYNGFWFLALVAGSAWFLIMMGIEMGALVVFKIRETRKPEQRIRLALMLSAFAFFTIYFPSYWSVTPLLSRTELAQVPVIGWGMGIGTSGALAPGFFVAILVTYVVIGSLSFLFGRRVLCSVLCNAPTMYQGTTIDAMSSFNRSSPIGRKYLSSRFSTAYSATTGLVLVSLVGASVASYLDSVGRWNVTIWGADPTYFLFSLYFGVLWYVMFVTIPYTGTYNCVTMGWCHWGTFSQAFSRLGFFRLKVRDKGVCQRCTTLDCAKVCPVGLVDMPGHFRTKGEFRSSKCCGVGDCIGACPHDNMYISDVRHWLRARLGVPKETSTPSRLPMVRPTAIGARPVSSEGVRARTTTSPGDPSS